MWRGNDASSSPLEVLEWPIPSLAVVLSLQRPNPTSTIYEFKNPHSFQQQKLWTIPTSTKNMASSKLRSSCSFPSLLLSCLNFTLFILSSASIVPIVLLKMPPTSLGFALLVGSCISLLSSFVGFYSQLTHMCCITHVSLLLASLVGQVLSILALFTREKPSLAMLKSSRDPREAKLLVRLECGVLMAMLMMQLVVLVLSCAVHNCWVREYEGLEAEREATAKKRSRRIARVQEESMANVAKIVEIKEKEFDDKMKSKYGHSQWVKTDFEG
ncbi:uncharacterized protein LOC18107698 [Populus trichocarpa]|nr:uncharacterized protein LOC18107698 [Populus trichocarpa]|eukprot:XP_024445790.1 uncharacterized protein LOC18107698 [Populus trichocarpa]